jgi:hypothetical protein
MKICPLTCCRDLLAAKEPPEQQLDEIYLKKLARASFDILGCHLVKTKGVQAGGL